MPHPLCLVLFPWWLTWPTSATFQFGYYPIGPVMNSRRLSAARLRFLGHLGPLEDLPPLPLAYWPEGYRPFLSTRPPSGLSRSAQSRCDWGGRPLYSGALGSSCRTRELPAPHVHRPCGLRLQPSITVFVNHLSGDLKMTEPHQGVTRVRPSSLAPPVEVPMVGLPWAFPLLRTAPLPVWPLGRGQAPGH